MTGNDIREIRISRNLTQSQFCAKIGLDNVSTLSRWENDRHVPSKIWQERIEKFGKEGKI